MKEQNVKTENLGKMRLFDGDLRDVWENEEKNFTPWLVSEAGRELLMECTGIELVDCRIEVPVSDGKFTADIIGRNQKGEVVVIENQFGTSNHDHLGKLITYAAGFDEGKNMSVIWIVEDERSEHRCAVRWLNEHTDDKLNFYLLKIQLWTIGDSPIAPYLTILEMPNGFGVNGKDDVREFTELKQKYSEFWVDFLKKYNADSDVRSMLGVCNRESNPHNWLQVGVRNINEFCVHFTISETKKYVGVALYVRTQSDFYNKMEAAKEEIEKNLGSEIEFSKGNLDARITCKDCFTVYDTADWDRFQKWLLENGKKFVKIASGYTSKK